MSMTMQYRTGDIWEVARQESAWVVIPTNTIVRKDGQAVMGAGLARDASDRFPGLADRLGKHIRHHGERLYVDETRTISLPTKRDWRDPSTMELVEQGCRELVELARVLEIGGNKQPILVPKLGCGLGGLNWERQVRPMVDALLDSERFILVSQP